MSEHGSNPRYGFLIDASLCIDCRTCMVSCSVENKVPMDNTRIWIEETGVTGTFPNLERYTVPFHCMHCKDPSCVSACTVAALTRNEDGIVVYDADVCIGCRYCVYACPFEVPNYEYNERFPEVIKCDMCFARLEEGQEPACAQTCPTGAIKFGRYEEMLALAHKMIKDNPDKYLPHVYGEHENGGTATMYISPVPFEELGFPIAQGISPAVANRLVTEGTPTVAAGAAIGLTGIYLTIKHAKEEGEEERREAEAERKAEADVKEKENAS